MGTSFWVRASGSSLTMTYPCFFFPFKWYKGCDFSKFPATRVKIVRTSKADINILF